MTQRSIHQSSAWGGARQANSRRWRVVGGTTYTAARKGEYFHQALNVPNSTAQYPSVEVKSLYGATQAETNKVFVAAASESPAQ